MNNWRIIQQVFNSMEQVRVNHSIKPHSQEYYNLLDGALEVIDYRIMHKREL